jgi:GH25 family lysozyme M1 (1,4-beta-N-acetylmuramidase)
MRPDLRSLSCLAALALSACVVGDLENGKAGDGLGDEKTDTGAVASRVCGDGPTTFGIDVSFYQGAFNWTTVRNAGVKFAFIRVSDGLNYPDSQFARSWAQAKSVGIIRGAYQFFRPGQDPIAQADLLLNAMGKLEPGDLPPVIDVEATSGLGAASVVGKIRQWVDRVKSRTGRTPIVYTGKYFWQDNVGNSAAFKTLPLWVAQYTSAACPDLPNAWGDWAFWQYSDSGSIAGISGGVDVNRFNGSVADLQAFITRNGGAATPAVAIEVYWQREADGTYQLRALAPAEITRVEYFVDGYAIGGATRAAGSNFPDSYRFSSSGTGRAFEVKGYDAGNQAIGLGVGSIDVTDGTAVYVKQMGAKLYEIGLERAPIGLAAIEVRVDGFLLTDGVSATTRATRNAVRSTFTTLGARQFEIRTFNADGTVRGNLYRTVTLR